MFSAGLIDGIIKEPIGGAHSNPDEMAELLKAKIIETLAEIQPKDPEERILERIEKYSKMGVYEEVFDIPEPIETAASNKSAKKK